MSLYILICICSFIILTSTGFAEENIFIDEYADDYDNHICLVAKQDAKTYHGKTEIYFALGFFTGPIGVALTVFKDVNVSKRCIYKTNNQFLLNNPTYLSCYKKTAKQLLIKYCIFGWIISILLMIFLIILSNRYR